jgi:hypothetical protein
MVRNALDLKPFELDQTLRHSVRTESPSCQKDCVWIHRREVEGRCASEAIRRFTGFKSGQGGMDHCHAEVGAVRRT